MAAAERWHLHAVLLFKPLYNGGLIQCYVLDESVCHFRGVGSIPWLLLYFFGFKTEFLYCQSNPKNLDPS